MQTKKSKRLTVKELENSKAFCMAPWVHLHLWPNGKTYPCCWSFEVLADLSENPELSLKDIWNSPSIRRLRTNMLNDKFSRPCHRCYELEKHGVTTLRKKFNGDYIHHWPLVEETKEDGSLDRINLPYVDVRYSNVCNFKCRTCTPELSSSWYDDAKKISPEMTMPKLKRLGQVSPAVLKELNDNVEHIEEIYFAGGEPLLMQEHYDILNRFIELKKFKVKLRYNTNFSHLKFKSQSILELWKHFENIHVGASLDGQGERAEYIRKGTDWEEIEKNRIELMRDCPHVFFNIESTISVFNALHIFDFIEDWIKKGFIQPQSFYANLLANPDYFNIQILPSEFKKKVEERAQQFIHWHEGKFKKKDGNAINSAKTIINFMNQKDSRHLWPFFLARAKEMDHIRQEDWTKTFPELSSYQSI